MTVELILFYDFTVKGYEHFRFDFFLKQEYTFLTSDNKLLGTSFWESLN